MVLLFVVIKYDRCRPGNKEQIFAAAKTGTPTGTVTITWEYDQTETTRNPDFWFRVWYPNSQTTKPDEIIKASLVSGYPIQKGDESNIYLYKSNYTGNKSGIYKFQMYAEISSGDNKIVSEFVPPSPKGYRLIDCNDSSCNNSENTLYTTDPISQAVYYGFCRYADNVSQCMTDSSERYATNIFPQFLPGSTCYPVSPTNSLTKICQPPCPPFAARVKGENGDGYASCISPYNRNDNYANNPMKIEQVDFNDWESESNPYLNGFIWTIDNSITTCILPMKNDKNQSSAIIVKRKILSGHPFLIWQTRFGNGDSRYRLFKNENNENGYPIFRLFHYPTKSVVSNKTVHAPNSGDCADHHMKLERVTGDIRTYDFDCFVNDNSSDKKEKCYLFSMWNKCAKIDGNSNKLNGGPNKVGDPIKDCYKVWNMPVHNSHYRQMVVKSPASLFNDDTTNPKTCQNGTPGFFRAITVLGTTTYDSKNNYGFYANANLSWPPLITSTTEAWVQPIQYCIPMSSGSEHYYNCNMYMYTFANTDSGNPSSYETIGWSDLFISSGDVNGDPQHYVTTFPGEQFNMTLTTNYVSNNNYTLRVEWEYFTTHPFNIGSVYTDPMYTNLDGKLNVYEATFGTKIPTINITNSGLLKTAINGVTHYLCTYSHGNTKLMLWINLDGNFIFDESVIIRCPMWAVYYTS